MVSFTIVLPVLNGMPWLPEAVQSVLAQREDVPVECIILDGGSTDGSREWLDGHAADVTTLVFQPDGGQTEALIRGFERATGEYLGWLNADDLFEPGALRRVAMEFESHPRAVALAGLCRMVDAKGQETSIPALPPSGQLQDLLRYPYNLPQPATFFHRSAYGRVGGLDPTLDLAMDVDLWMKLAALAPIHLVSDQVLAQARIHPRAKSVSRSYECLREVFQVRRRHGLPITSRAWWYHLTHGYVTWFMKLKWLGR